tara:strand:- start:685 stop:1056 length:372 start_codon:yes stop_codon:yes gene_type:complete
MKAPTTEIDCLSIYERMAASYFNDLKQLKAQRRVLDQQIKEAENRLSQALAQGDLRLWQDPENKNSFYYDDTCYVFCPGRVSFDYSECEDVKHLEENLRVAKSVAAATGQAQEKQGKPFWSVR